MDYCLVERRIVLAGLGVIGRLGGIGVPGFIGGVVTYQWLFIGMRELLMMYFQV
jgi:hypothetical protein